MSHVIRLLLVVAFVSLGLGLPRLEGEQRRRRAQGAFIAFVLGLSVLVGIAQKDAWPFSPYPVLAEDARGAATLERVVVKAVDATGREWDVHPMAWSPLPAPKIASWIGSVHGRLSPAQQRSAERFLLERAEAARRDRRAGREVGSRRWLGGLAAPHWLRVRDVDAPAEPFVALRAYSVRWKPREVLGDPGRSERHLLFDTARP
jgi:hypothetical protein